MVVMHEGGDDAGGMGARVAAPNEIQIGGFDEELVLAGGIGERTMSRGCRCPQRRRWQIIGRDGLGISDSLLRSAGNDHGVARDRSWREKIFGGRGERGSVGCLV